MMMVRHIKYFNLENINNHHLSTCNEEDVLNSMPNKSKFKTCPFDHFPHPSILMNRDCLQGNASPVKSTFLLIQFSTQAQAGKQCATIIKKCAANRLDDVRHY